MSKMHLQQLAFTCSTCGPLTKNKTRIKKVKETRYSKYIYQSKLDNAYSQCGMAFGDFNDLPRRAVSDKVLRDKAFEIAKNLKYDGYQRGLASLVYNICNKKLLGSGVNEGNMSNEKLAKELHKPVIRKFEKQKAHLSFIDNILGADLADMQLISKFKAEFRFFYYVLLIFIVKVCGLFL